jgi:hypothetical protein
MCFSRCFISHPCINGVTNSVKKGVATARPQTMAEATGPHRRESPPQPKAREMRPSMTVRVVMMMGSRRRRAAHDHQHNVG